MAQLQSRLGRQDYAATHGQAATPQDQQAQSAGFANAAELNAARSDPVYAGVQKVMSQYASGMATVKGDPSKPDKATVTDPGSGITMSVSQFLQGINQGLAAMYGSPSWAQVQRAL